MLSLPLLFVVFLGILMMFVFDGYSINLRLILMMIRTLFLGHVIPLSTSCFGGFTRRRRGRSMRVFRLRRRDILPDARFGGHWNSSGVVAKSQPSQCESCRTVITVSFHFFERYNEKYIYNQCVFFRVVVIFTNN